MMSVSIVTSSYAIFFHCHGRTTVPTPAYISLGPSCLAEPLQIRKSGKVIHAINSLENYFSYYALTSHMQ